MSPACLQTQFPLKGVLGAPRARARQKGLKIEAILARARAARPGPHSPKVAVLFSTDTAGPTKVSFSAPLAYL